MEQYARRGPIGYLVPEFPQQTHIFFWREIQELRRKGVELRLISTRRPDLSLCRHSFAEVAAQQTHYVYPPRLGQVLRRAMAGAPRVPQALRYLAALSAGSVRERLKHIGLLACALELASYAREQSIQHIHAHSCADAAHLLALCRCCGGPSYSLTLHGDLGVYGADHQSKMAGAAFVSVVGHHLQRQVLKETTLTSDRVWVTCMGIESRRLAELPDQRRYASNELRIVTVARLNAVKGHVHALAAVRALIEEGLAISYCIVGGGDYLEVLQRRVAELELKSVVRFAGSLSEENVMAELMAADVFVLPSVGQGEAWPVAVMEAMGCGLPVVSTVIGATAEMIVPDVDGILVPQRDEAALTAALRRLAREPELRRRLGASARNTARERFDVGTTAGRLAQAIDGAQGLPPTQEA